MDAAACALPKDRYPDLGSYLRARQVLRGRKATEKACPPLFPSVVFGLAGSR